MFKSKINTKELAMREIIKRATPHVYMPSYIGCGHFIIKREHAGAIETIIEEFDDTGQRNYEDERAKKVIPKEIGAEFVPVKTGFYNYAYVTDGKKPFNANYWWLLCEVMGFTIHGDDPTKSHALVKNGEIVGSCMFMKADILDYKEAA